MAVDVCDCLQLPALESLSVLFRELKCSIALVASGDVCVLRRGLLVAVCLPWCCCALHWLRVPWLCVLLHNMWLRLARVYVARVVGMGRHAMGGVAAVSSVCCYPTALRLAGCCRREPAIAIDVASCGQLGGVRVQSSVPSAHGDAQPV